MASSSAASYHQGHGSSSSSSEPVAVVRLVEALARRTSPHSNVPALTSFCMQLLGSNIRSTSIGDVTTLGISVQKRVRQQGGDYRRVQELLRRLSGSRLFHHKSEALQLLLLLNEYRSVGGGTDLELVAPLTGTGLPALPTDDLYRGVGAPATAPPTVGGTASATGDRGPGKEGVAVSTFVPWQLRNDLSFAVSEALLLRDLVFVFQGIDGTFVYYDAKADAYVVDRKVTLPAPTRALVTRLAELGWVYRRLHGFLERNLKHGAAAGLVAQSLCFALQDELTDYFRLLAVLEAQINQEVLAGKGSEEEPGAAPAGAAARTPATGLTLRRLLVWTQDPLLRMRLLASLAEATEGMRGGALATAVYRHCQHGDGFVRSLYERMLQRMCGPLFAMIQRWVMEGDLADDFGEFFVVADASVPDALLWQDKYSIRESMRPCFVPAELVNQMLQIGKSINFIRVCCDDKEWVMEGAAALLEGGNVQFGDNERLLKMTAHAAESANRRLVAMLFDKYKLLDHCRALKRYMLLGQGDFVQLLMMQLGAELDKGASQQFRHNLMGIMEAALRSSNAQFEHKDILGRLDIKLLDSSDGEDGWDIFALTYKVDAPISAVITPACMKRYMRIFNFLWQLKRVEYSLNATWCRHMTAAHVLEAIPVLRGAFHRCHLLRTEMVHLVSTLANYVMFEVLETSWELLVTELGRARDMDGLIAAHEKYLDRIFEKALMTRSAESLTDLMKLVFSDVLEFVRVQEQLYTKASIEVESQRAATAAARDRTKAGTWATGVDDDRAAVAGAKSMAEVASRTITAVAALREGFQSHVLEVLQTLKRNESRIEEFRSLLVNLDYNEYYHKLMMAQQQNETSTTTATTTAAAASNTRVAASGAGGGAGATSTAKSTTSTSRRRR